MSRRGITELTMSLFTSGLEELFGFRTSWMRRYAITASESCHHSKVVRMCQCQWPEPARAWLSGVRCIHKILCRGPEYVCIRP
jgi:hypothetical protein